MTTRTQVLAAIRAALTTPTPQTDAGTEVRIGQIVPLFASHMPLVVIHSPQRKVLNNLSDPGGARHWELTVAIEAYAAGRDAETAAEKLAVQIGACLERDPTLGRLVEDMRLIEAATETAVDGDQIFAGVVLAYECACWQRAGEQDDTASPALATSGGGAVVFDPEADDYGDGYAPLARDALDNGAAPDHIRRVAIDAKLIDAHTYTPGTAFENHAPLSATEAATADAPVLLVRETRILTLPAIHRDSATRPGRTGVFVGQAPEVGPDHEDAYTAVDAWVNGE
ncbi:hypothetical protein [Fodinicurvata sp. EGI_FJ10296]|uniref:hypothetical protein n=1 Tax=Fodinicurvata sp. EGI_FJ10296 TaxID=3231908 RepID=UPI003454F524